jgi:hypothetical protein
VIDMFNWLKPVRLALEALSNLLTYGAEPFLRSHKLCSYSRVDSAGSGWWPVADSYEQGNEPSSPTKFCWLSDLRFSRCDYERVPFGM